jgi:hypothetical protein
MAYAHGKDTFFSVDGVDLSGFTDSTEFTDDSDMSEVTAYGRSRKNYIQGMEDGTVTASGSYDYGATGPGATLTPLKRAGEPVTLILQVAGPGTGLPQRSVDVLVKKFVTSHPAADKVAWSAEFQMVSDEIDDTPQV